MVDPLPQREPLPQGNWCFPLWLTHYHYHREIDVLSISAPYHYHRGDGTSRGAIISLLQQGSHLAAHSSHYVRFHADWFPWLVHYHYHREIDVSSRLNPYHYHRRNGTSGVVAL